MGKRKLGRSGIEVSALGMGCWAIGGPWWSADGNPCGWGRVDDAESIRAYGWSTDLVDRARVFAQGEHCASVQFSLSMVNVNMDMLALCDEFDLGCVNKKPLASGFLTGKFTPESTFAEDEWRSRLDLKDERTLWLMRKAEELREILTSGGRTMAQAAIGWLWARHERPIPIPGFKTVAQVEENAGAMHFGPLSPEQMAEVERILEREGL